MEDRMTTPRTRAAVSLVASALTLALGACAHPGSSVARPGPAPAEDRALAIRFDNEATVHVDVYLVGEQRQWLLGRVEPGAAATLRLPSTSLAPTAGFVRLVALADSPRSVMAARDPHAIVAMEQPLSAIVSQRWTLSRSAFAAPQLFGAPRDRGRR
jgi:hypothetical protein